MLSDVWRLTSVWRRLSRTSWIFMAPTATGSTARWTRRPGVRRVWAGAGPQHAAYRGGSISWRSPAYNLLLVAAAAAATAVAVVTVTVACCESRTHVHRNGKLSWCWQTRATHLEVSQSPNIVPFHMLGIGYN